MKLLFLTLLDFDSLQEKNIYTDLLREFVKNRHEVYVISPVEKRKNVKTHVNRENQVTILKLCIGNMQKTNIVEKGISMLTIEHRVISAIKQYFSNEKFDLVLYSTPPITFCNAISFVKKRDDARTYLMLKDIFPQNAVDMGMLSNKGWKALLYWYFRKKEKTLYEISDSIGCMSKANIEYVLNHNENVRPDIVELCPNCVEVVDKSIDLETRIRLRNKYSIPIERKVFIYGGNLGKPQGIPFLIDCIKAQAHNTKAFFVIVGDGTEYGKIDSFIKNSEQENVLLLKRMPKEDYDNFVSACDVGMIFLDYRFTIPNYPSRILSYMQAKIPVLAVTDKNTDVGKDIVNAGFGWWSASDDIAGVTEIIEKICQMNLSEIGKKGFDFLCDNYTVEKQYDIIVK